MAPDTQLSSDVEWSCKAGERQITFRSTVAGLCIGSVILISNFQFGLQTGWVSMMSLPAALLGFAVFKTLEKKLGFPFTDVENVFVQSVAVAVATGPLAYGFIGIIPAIEKFLTDEESGYIVGIDLKPLWKLMAWSMGVAFFGVFFAIPLRKEFVIRENLPFPSGSATATLISVFHGTSLKLNSSTVVNPSPQNDDTTEASETSSDSFSNPVSAINSNTPITDNQSPIPTYEPQPSTIAPEDIEIQVCHSLHTQALSRRNSFVEGVRPCRSDLTIIESGDICRLTQLQEYHSNLKLLGASAGGASIYTIISYFVPILRAIPIFGQKLSQDYLINFQPSPAYIGQGIIMGLQTTSYMLFGTVLGWFILSPLAHWNNWAPGNVDDWKTGSEGWIMWISLSIMISDSVVSLVVIILKSLLSVINSIYHNSDRDYNAIPSVPQSCSLENNVSGSSSYNSTNDEQGMRRISKETTNTSDMTLEDVSSEHLVPLSWVLIGLAISGIICCVTTRIVFGPVIPTFAVVISIVMSLFLSLLGVKALGETDLNPVSGIGKLSQLICALMIPKGTRGSILINLISGAISEATTQQAGDLMQDLKTGYLLGASPKAQFAAQIYGSVFSIFMSSVMYKVYMNLYQIPGKLFKIPTAVIWIDCARLVNGSGLPPKVMEFSLVFGTIFGIISLLKNLVTNPHNGLYKYLQYLPDGVPVGIGIYNIPSFTFARFIGGLASYYWLKKKSDDPSSLRDNRVKMIIFSSGLVLGEGLFSVVNMILASLHVPHM